jgi:predicted transcriptional regulator of viral defense system
MTKQDVVDIANKNNGYLYSKVIKENDIPTSYIVRLVKEGVLAKVARGVYVSEAGVEDELFINSIKYNRIIYSGETALFLNGLSNKQTFSREFSIPFGTHVPVINGYAVKYSRKKTFSLGSTEVKTPFGNKVRCYDKERCICDLFIRPDDYDYEDRVYAINEYKSKYLDFKKLYEYARQLGVYQKVQNVFEVIGWN